MKISVKILADFMMAGPSRQRTLIRNAKFPKLQDGKTKPQILRYSEARASIRDFHEAGNDLKVLLNAVERLTKKRVEFPERDAARLNDNIRAIKAYAAQFSKRQFTVLATPRPTYVLGQIEVSATPDLYVEEGGVRKLIKLDFNQERPKDGVVPIILKVMHEASSVQGLGVKPKDVLYVDVSRERTLTGEKLNKKLKKEIDAALTTIQDMWGNLKQE
jgi:hypothetical protein